MVRGKRKGEALTVNVSLPGSTPAPAWVKAGKSHTEFAIQAFVGANGSGKSLAIVEMAVLPAWRSGRLVVSNMPLYPSVLGYDEDLYQPLHSWRDIAKMGTCQLPTDERCEPGECVHSSTAGRPALLVLDEASAALPSRSSASTPTQLIRVLNQLRKRDVYLVWSAPAWARMDLAVRETTGAVTVCTSSWVDTVPRVNVPGIRKMFPPKALDEDGRPLPRLEPGWAPRRLFFFKTFEAQSYDEFTLAKTQKLRPRAKRYYWRSRHDAQHAYGTLEGVDLLDHLSETGACMDCGLKRHTAFCSCPGSPRKGAGRPARAGGAHQVNGSEPVAEFATSASHESTGG